MMGRRQCIRSDTIQPTNLKSPGNNKNIPSNTPYTNSNTISSKIQLDSDKYYHIRKIYVDKGVEQITKGLELGVDKVCS